MPNQMINNKLQVEIKWSNNWYLSRIRDVAVISFISLCWQNAREREKTIGSILARILWNFSTVFVSPSFIHFLYLTSVLKWCKIHSVSRYWTIVSIWWKKWKPVRCCYFPCVCVCVPYRHISPPLQIHQCISFPIFSLFGFSASGTFYGFDTTAIYVLIFDRKEEINTRLLLQKTGYLSVEEVNIYAFI